jgi:hypothetical protein
MVHTGEDFWSDDKTRGGRGSHAACTIGTGPNRKTKPPLTDDSASNDTLFPGSFDIMNCIPFTFNTGCTKIA